MKPSTGFFILCVLSLLACAGFFALMQLQPISNLNHAGSTAQAQLREARATGEANALYTARETPLSDSAVVGIEGMKAVERMGDKGLDTVQKVAEDGFNTARDIAVSGDASQTSIAWAGTFNACAAPLALVGAGLLIIAIKWNISKKNEQKVEDKQ